MNSKERVLKTIRREKPDRVPIGEWGIDHDHVTAIIGRHTYWRNRRDTQLAVWEGRRDEAVESMERDYAELIETLDYDVVPVELVPPKGAPPTDPPREVEPGVWRNSSGVTWQYSAANDSIMRVTPSPAREHLSEADVDAAREEWLSLDESTFEVLDYIAERFAGTRAVVFRGLEGQAPMMAPFGGDEEHRLMMMALAPREIEKMRDIAVEHNRLLSEHAASKGVLIAMQGKDYGSTHGCIISPETIRSLFMPVHRRIAEDARALGMRPFFHCCGRIWDILDDWVAAGYEGYQSIQGTAGMDLAKVKARYGEKLVLWAGIQCETLVEGTLEEVEEEVKRALEICMPGGGFIFGSTNSVQFGAKTDNYLKALETVRKYGTYD